MRSLIISSLGFLFIGCGESQPEPMYLTKEYYEWTCSDYVDSSEIVITTKTCEDHETGLYWLISETQMVHGQKYKRKLDKTNNWNIDCVYETVIPLLEDYCIAVEGVTLTAYVEPATWSGALFDN